MGAGQSKEVLLYQAVAASNHQAVKTLHREGASLEFLDKEGRTPLILACTRGDLYDMVITLLNEGAKLDAYRSGPHGGYALHHAAKRGLAKTVLLLLSRGANPLATNDEGLTPLDMARSKAHVSVVRIIEDRICLFSGTVRELSGPGFLEVLVPQFVTKKVWVAVLPMESDPRKPPRNELVIYQNERVAIPRTVISLTKAQVEEPKFNHHDPTLVITTKVPDNPLALDKTPKVKFKFMAENEGDKALLKSFYIACARGTRQTESGPPPAPLPAQSSPPQISRPQLSPRPSPPNLAGQTTPGIAAAAGHVTHSSSRLPPSEPIPDDVALALAVNASIISASQEGVQVPPPAAQHSSSPNGRRTSSGRSDGENPETGEYGDWNVGDQRQDPGRVDYGGWDAGDQSSSSWGSGSKSGAGPSKLAPSLADSPGTSGSMINSGGQVAQTAGSPKESLLRIASPGSSSTLAPSAPPLPLDGPIRYPSVDTSPVQVNYAPVAGPNTVVSAPVAKQKAEEKSSGQCVVCWDAPANAVSVPCGHLSACMSCLTEIKSKDWGCPVCRAPIQQVVKVFAV